MKNITCKVIAMILWIAAVTVGYAQQYSFEISVSPRSQKTTAYAWGTKYASHVAYDITNLSGSAVTISRLWFERSWTVSDIFIEDGEKLIKATHRDNYTGDLGVAVDITIPAKGTHTVFVRGTIIEKPFSDEVAMTFIRYHGLEIKSEYNGMSFSYLNDLLHHHAVIVEQSAVPQIKNSSGLQRLESMKAYGFVITGDRFMQSRVMIRVAGPALARLGVRDTVTDPMLRVIDEVGKVVADSNDWSASLTSRFAEVGAFAFIQGSKDAALELELSPGMYTVEVRSVDTAQVGTYLIETYQMSAASVNPVIVTPPSVSALGAKG